MRVESGQFTRLPACLLALLLCVPGCPAVHDPAPPDDPAPPPGVMEPPVDPVEPPPPREPPGPPAPEPASVSGRLAVQADPNARTVFEQEPNDSLTQAQFIARVRPGQRITIFGEVSVLTGDVFDAFEFVAEVPVLVNFALHFIDDGIGTPVDLDLSVFDFENFNCSPDDASEPEFAHCFNSTEIPETGMFEIEGPFVLVVTPFTGGSRYQLEIEFLPPEAGHDEADPAMTAARDGVPLKVNPAVPGLRSPFAAVSDDFRDGELLVRFAEGIPHEEQDRILHDHGMTCVERSPSGVLRVACPVAEKADARLRRIQTLQGLSLLRDMEGVDLVEPNERRYIALTPDDEYFHLQWHYQAINLQDAWNITVGSDDIIVAVVDTGILSGHPDIQGRLVAGYDFIADPEAARDGDGRDPDPEDEGDLFGGPGRSTFHGTHVTGTIAAATNNGIGVAGVTWATKIMPLRALGVGGGSTFDVAESIRFAAGLPNVSGTLPDQPAHIINLSIASAAGAPPSSTESAAIEAAAGAGAIIIGAAGNQSSDLPTFPAAHPDVIAVSAVDIQLQLAPYSNRGSWIDLAAPGGFTGTDINGDGFGDGVLSTGGSDPGGVVRFEYVFSQGTSMAVPHVSGVAALMLSVNPNLTAADVRDILQATARDLGPPGPDDSFGHGLLDAAAAVREALIRGGGAPEGQPRMALTASSLDFNFTRREISVGISNTGGGFLNVTSVEVEERDGQGWLEAEPAGGSVRTSASELLVSVTRTGQPEGTYRGTIIIHADGVPPATLDVTMRVGTPTVLDEPIFVLAVHPTRLDTIAQDVTTAADDWAYVLRDLPPGDYAIYAGTDRSDDGFICDIGDLCGALPSLTRPHIVTVTEGQEVTDADFSVAEVVLQQVTPERNPGLRLQRLLTAHR